MLKAKGYHASDKVFPLLALFNDRSTENKKREPVTRIYMTYSEIVAEAMGEVGRRTRRKEKLDSLEKE